MPHEQKYNPQLAKEIEDDVLRLTLMWASLDYPAVQTVGVASSTLLVTLIDMLDETQMEKLISTIHKTVETFRAQANEIKGESDETVH